MSGGLAILAGDGDLPRLLAEDAARRNAPYTVVQFQGVDLLWAAEHPVTPAIIEKPGHLVRALRVAGCDRITMAGGMRRPALQPLRFDMAGVRLAARVARASQGDDAVLRVLAAFFEESGFKVIAPQELLAGLTAQAGCPTKAQPSEADLADIARASEIATALGAIDVGQAAVVAQGICLGVESIQGTQALLEFVARTSEGMRTDPEGAKGVLVKLPKPAQDTRVDLPAIGPLTMEQAAAAGLAGVVVQDGGALILGLQETITAADARGLFLLILERT